MRDYGPGADGQAVLSVHCRFVPRAEHEALVDYLAPHQRDIWVTTFGELMDYMAAKR
jgi:hypothetical protein